MTRNLLAVTFALTLIACGDPPPDAVSSGGLQAGEKTSPVEPVEYVTIACDDCGPPLDFDACHIMEHADAVAIIVPDSDPRPFDKLCIDAMGRTTTVNVVGHVWGQPLPVTLDLFDSVVVPEIVGLRQVDGYWATAFSWPVRLEVSDPEPNPEMPLPSGWDALVAEFAAADSSAACDPAYETDGEFSSRVFGQCDLEQAPFPEYDSYCDGVADHYYFTCERSYEDAVAVADACEVASTGKGDRDQDQVAICYRILECDTTADAARIACDLDVEPACKGVFETMRSCGSTEAEAASLAQTECTDVIETMTQSEADAYTSCVDQLHCDVILSGYAQDEC